MGVVDNTYNIKDDKFKELKQRAFIQAARYAPEVVDISFKDGEEIEFKTPNVIYWRLVDGEIVSKNGKFFARGRVVIRLFKTPSPPFSLHFIQLWQLLLDINSLEFLIFNRRLQKEDMLTGSEVNSLSESELNALLEAKKKQLNNLIGHRLVYGGIPVGVECS